MQLKYNEYRALKMSYKEGHIYSTYIQGQKIKINEFWQAALSMNTTFSLCLQGTVTVNTQNIKERMSYNLDTTEGKLTAFLKY